MDSEPRPTPPTDGERLQNALTTLRRVARASVDVNAPYNLREKASPEEISEIFDYMKELRPRAIWHGKETPVKDGRKAIYDNLKTTGGAAIFLRSTRPEDEYENGWKNALSLQYSIDSDELPDFYFTFFLSAASTATPDGIGSTHDKDEYDLKLDFGEDPLDREHLLGYESNRALIQDMTKSEFEVARYYMRKTLEEIPPIKAGSRAFQNEPGSQNPQ